MLKGLAIGALPSLFMWYLIYLAGRRFDEWEVLPLFF
jgi:hypothetical protein